jgi:hypothetical protein
MAASSSIYIARHNKIEREKNDLAARAQQTNRVYFIMAARSHRNDLPFVASCVPIGKWCRAHLHITSDSMEDDYPGWERLINEPKQGNSNKDFGKKKNQKIHMVMANCRYVSSRSFLGYLFQLAYKVTK